MSESDLYLFGPKAAPVGLAGISEAIRSLGAQIQRFTKSEEAELFVLQGGSGTGKTTAATAVQAESQQDGVTSIFVNTGTVLSEVLPLIGRGQVERLIVDDFDQLSPKVQESLVLGFAKIRRGSFLTVSAPGPWLHQGAFESAIHEHVPPLETRPEDCTVIANFLWQQILDSPEANLIRNCDASAITQLERGPWTQGTHSLRRCLELLAEQQALRGSLQDERLTVSLYDGDILAAMVEVIRETSDVTQVHDRSLTRVIVEGDTDRVYLIAAAAVGHRNWGVDPLRGLLVEPAGSDREGGANAVVKSLIALGTQRFPAFGLLDNDGPGREARKTAGKFGLLPVLLPREFDRLQSPSGQEEVEIEDLVDPGLLDRFYEEHEQYAQERTRIEKGRLVRIVVGGAHKMECAEWVANHATLEDIERILYVIYVIRDQLKFTRTESEPDPHEWLDRLLGTT